MLPRTLQKRRQIDAWELDEFEPEREDRQRDVDDVDDVNDADPTPPSVLQQACSPSHLVQKKQRGQDSFAQKGGGCVMRSNASSRKISFFPELIDVALLGWVIWKCNEGVHSQAR